ncbi:MAG: phosphoribosylanthranilate isomerase [Eubacteriaceae bacterium]
MKIKICGISRDCDIDYVNEAQPDYIGFVFAKSKRKVTMEQAIKMKKRLDSSIVSVGVFVNEAVDVINEMLRQGVIDIAQLHGNESEEYISKLDMPVIKAVRFGERMPKNADFILLDGENPGSGEVLDWKELPEISKPFFLAGGISLENIEEAMKIKSYGIDISSGAETEGFKDKEKISELVRRGHNV